MEFEYVELLKFSTVKHYPETESMFNRVGKTASDRLSQCELSMLSQFFCLLMQKLGHYESRKELS